MSYITTYTGKHFDPVNPDASLLCIEDIAHALSLLCRGNGHVQTFFSVGQHCIACAKEAQARGLSARLVLACLLHDASECYMSDVPRPFKQTLPEYTRLEDQLLDMIYMHFLGSTLWYDLTYLLHEKQPLPKPQVYDEPDYTVRPFTDVEEEYLRIYHFFFRLIS